MSERQLAGLRYLEDKGRITMQEYAKATDSRIRTAKRDMKELVEKKVLAKHGKTKGSWYALPEE